LTRRLLEGSFHELSLGSGLGLAGPGLAGVGFTGSGASSIAGRGIGRFASGSMTGSKGGALSLDMIGARNGDGQVTHSAGHGCQQVLWYPKHAQAG
jgi:hypothetical protein